MLTTPHLPPSVCLETCHQPVSARFAQVPLYTFCSARIIPQLFSHYTKTPHATPFRPAGLRQKLSNMPAILIRPVPSS